MKVFKYNEDDILEIVIEYLADESEFKTYGSKAILLGEAGENLRVVVAISDFEDESISSLDLEQVDKSIEFNGSH